SEHSALFQCLEGRTPEQVDSLVLTGSGGPFRGRTRDELTAVTPEEALAHPTWRMGPKITVDSATLANKGLELIEAHFLFGIPYERIEVAVAAFLDGRLPFLEISGVVADALARADGAPALDLADLLEVDRAARAIPVA